MKVDNVNIRVTPETKKQLLIEAHLAGQTISKLVLNAVYLSLCERNIKAADVYEDMRAKEADAVKQERFKELSQNAIRRAHVWKSHYMAIDESEIILEDIEALTAYRDAIAMEVSEKTPELA